MTDSYLEIVVKAANHIGTPKDPKKPEEGLKIPLGTTAMVMTTGIFLKDGEDPAWKDSMRKSDSSPAKEIHIDIPGEISRYTQKT